MLISTFSGLTSNASCVETAVQGCTVDQLESLKWWTSMPSNIDNGDCGINDFDKELFCTSSPVCDSESLLACVREVPRTCR